MRLQISIFKFSGRVQPETASSFHLKSSPNERGVGLAMNLRSYKKIILESIQIEILKNITTNCENK